VPHAAQGCPVVLAHPYTERYSAGGAKALTDGVWGTPSFGDGHWQGFEGKDLHATLDLGEEIPVRSIRVGFIQDHKSWVFLPREVSFALSMDGTRFDTVASFQLAAPTKMQETATKDIYSRVDGVKARYVRVIAKNFGPCPEWHPGNGGDSWLFADEIQVNPRLK
jgi:hypothetical protein